LTKTTLVTGASRGIGQPTAELSGERQWSVGVNYVGNQQAAEQVMAAIAASGGR
jgi:NAD(P)-dependent dehydrogenase (short-subunit alcohol dehydrogenase family)